MTKVYPNIYMSHFTFLLPFSHLIVYQPLVSRPVVIFQSSFMFILAFLLSSRCFTFDLMYMLHPIREIAHFMNWPNFCPLHEPGRYVAHFMNWAGILHTS
jgi:hypothetical protein